MTYVLIPGAGGAAWYWHRLLPLLHDAVAVDLPAADENAGLQDYADAVVRVAKNIEDIVLVAQSMGAFTAPLTCDRLPVRRIVLVNPMIPAPGETAGDWWANTGQITAAREQAVKAGRDPDAPFDPLVTFFHDVPDDITAEGLAGAPDQAGRPFGEPWPLDAWPAIPTRVLTGRDDRLFPAAFQTRLAEERLDVTPIQLGGGHLVALSHPAELAELIR